MHPRKVQLDRADARAPLALAALFAVGLAGCAAAPMNSSSGPGAYVGVFTGEFVDGKPLYRFPTIEVVGSRRIEEAL